MANHSSHFTNLTNSFEDLKSIYLPKANSTSGYSPEEQERARGFTLMVHAEIEHYIEQVCNDSCEEMLDSFLKKEIITSSVLSFLSFNSLPSLNGGESLGSKDKISRKISTRFFEAKIKYLEIIASNEGIKERNLAKLLIPLGLTRDHVDTTWLADVETFASSRGRFAHMSRNSKEASPMTVNPDDVYLLSKRILFTDPALKTPGLVASFQDLDEWLANLRNPAAASPSQKNIFSGFFRLVRNLLRN